MGRRIQGKVFPPENAEGLGLTLCTEKVREKLYCLSKPSKSGPVTYKLSHFSDTKRDYVQFCPPRFLRSLDERLAQKCRLERLQGPRECLLKAKDIYRGDNHEEVFVNTQEKRKQVKFGFLFGYARDDAKKA